jgi:hypothetical protein
MSTLVASGALASCGGKAGRARLSDLFAFHRAYQTGVIRVIERCDEGAYQRPRTTVNPTFKETPHDRGAYPA